MSKSYSTNFGKTQSTYLHFCTETVSINLLPFLNRESFLMKILNSLIQFRKNIFLEASEMEVVFGLNISILLLLCVTFLVGESEGEK